ncbi:MAG TPA: cytochrome c [Chloroflexota bacterium]|nr:cytochrome c [Chloroflexota bacterium]
MSLFPFEKRRARHGLMAAAVGLGLVQASLVLAAAPTPNPLAPGPNPVTSPVPGVDITVPGPAAAIHGDPVGGAAKFNANCASCHGARGTAGITNPNSSDGTVPVLNPIDPGFIDDSNGDAAIFARELDVFLQHGSRPAGPNPLITMPGFGDHHLLPQSDIADIEAYVMQLNGTFWPDRCPGIRLELANPSPAARVEPGNLVVQGRAMDARAQHGSGIDRVDFFLDARDSGGRMIGTTNPAAVTGPAGASSFQATVSLPAQVGGHNLVAYAHSSVTSQESVVSIPIAIGEDPVKAFAVVPTGQSINCAP